MIIILLILAVLGFAISFIFTKNKVKRVVFSTFFFLLLLICEAGLILNDQHDWGMRNIVSHHTVSLESISKTEDVLFYTESDMYKIYHYKDSSNAQEVETPIDSEVQIKFGSKEALCTEQITELQYKNTFYQFLFFLTRKNDEAIETDIVFELPDNWQVKELKELKK